MKLNKAIGKKLVRFRSHGGVTQQQLANHIGISRGYLSDLERGTKSMSIEMLVRLCKRTGLTASSWLEV